MSDVVTVSTDSVAPRHRLDFWRAVVATTFAPFDFSVSPSTEFHGTCKASRIDDLLVAQTDCASSAAARRKNMIRSADFDGFMFVICNKGCIGYSDDGSASIANPGDVAFYDYSRPCNFNLVGGNISGCHQGSRKCIESINITVPRNTLTRIMGPARKGVGLVLRADQPSAPIIRTFFSALMALTPLLDTLSATRMAAIGLDLLAAGLAERLSHEQRQTEGAASLAYRAKTFIVGRLGDSSLDTAMVAAAMHVSVRRLQMVFAEQQTTVDGFLWERRLQKAYQQLRDSAFDRMSISEIAYGVGFISQAHFTRRFVQRFAQTPTDCRRTARLSSGLGV